MSRYTDNQHPAAWWGFAVIQSMAVTATNALGFSLVSSVCSAALVAGFAYSEMARRNFRLIAFASIVLVGIRVLFQNLFGYPMGSHVVLDLPAVSLPEWLAGIRLGGPVTSESIMFALNDGGRIAAIALTFAAIASITSPTRILRALPLSLHSAGMLLVIAVTFLPHLLADLSRVRHAARWRGQKLRGVSAVTAQLINVAESALDRSVTLAAALNTRGYIQPAAASRHRAGLLVSSLLLLMFAMSTITFGLSPLTMIGILLSLVLMWLNLDASSRTVSRTRYRSEVWTARDTALLAVPAISLALSIASHAAWMWSAISLGLGLMVISLRPRKSRLLAVSS